MARPKGTAKTGGRQSGTPNKATSEVRAAARQHAPSALDRLAWLSSNAASEAAQVAACKEILDRAYGKAAQEITAEGGGMIVVQLSNADHDL